MPRAIPMQFLRRHQSAWLVAGAWLVFAVWAVVATAHGGGPQLVTDDAMRLVQVRDFLNGQGWYDTTQHRMNTPFGLAMHWSRLIDAGIAGVYLLFRLVLNPAAAETATLYLWPLLPFLALLAALYRTASVIGGRSAGVVVLLLALTCTGIWDDFSPGSLDHHNVQLALAAWMIAFLVESRGNPRAAVYAGLVAALSLAIGIEALPFVAVAAACMAAFWSWHGGAWKQQARGFGGAFAAAGAGFLAVVATPYRFGVACDTYSGFYAALAVAGGAGLFATTHLPLQTRRGRALFIAVLCLALVALGAALNPACLRGPYGEVDPRLVPIWLSRVYEAQSALGFARIAASQFVFGYVYAVGGLLAAAVFLFVSRRAPAAAAMLCAFSTAGVAVATWEFRAYTFPIVASLPCIAWLVASVFRHPRMRGLLGPLAGTLALLVSTDAAFAIVGGTFVESAASLSSRIGDFNAQLGCASPRAMHLLDHRPPGRVVAFVDQGPAVLAGTRNSVVAGPYHRNAAGILDDDTLFAGNPRAAAAVLRRRGIDYVMVCRAAHDWTFYRRHAAPGALISQLASNAPPVWLHLMAQDSTDRVAIYAVDRAALP